MIYRTWLLLAILAAGCGSASAPTAPSAVPVAAQPIPRVVVLGDSLAVTPSLAESFPAVLQQRMNAAGLRWTVTNAGVSGDTTADGVRRVNPLLEADVEVLVVALGANDGLDHINTATVERNLSTIIEAARGRQIAVVLCGLETTPLNGFDYMVAFHRVFPRVAQTYGTPLVPFLLNGVALIPEMNGPDRVHPNAAGARRIADNVWPYLEPLLRQAAVTAG